MKLSVEQLSIKSKGDFVNQFEKLIIEESSNICEQLNSAEEARNRIRVKPLKEAAIAVWAMLIIIVVYTIFLFLTKQRGELSMGFVDTCHNFEAMILQPYTHSFSLGDAIFQLSDIERVEMNVD